MISIVTHSEMDPLVVLDPVDNWIVSAEVDCQCSWTLEEFGTKCICQANDESEASDDDSSEEESENEENKKPRAPASGGGAASKRRRKE